jgi:hypothetical protein
MEMHPVFRFFDPVFIWFYRITGEAPVDFVIGTLVLALLALAVGEFTLRLVLLLAKPPLDRAAAEARKYQDLSIAALAAGDRPSYEAANRLANDAFSKTFYMQIAQSGAFLWPVCVVLAWMGYRFGDLVFPLPGGLVSLGYIGVFILLYIPAYFLFGRVKKRLALSRRAGEVQGLNPPAAGVGRTEL